MSHFIGIYKAIYSYAPQSQEELKINENDLLYLLEKSEIDDWWKVKVKIDGDGIDEPAGLVPSNYIEVADVIGEAKALYDYEKQTEEEISFKENDVFQIYDKSDPDWFLVGLNNQFFGFIPSNYVDLNAPAVIQQTQPMLHFPPPPQHRDRSHDTTPVASNDHQRNFSYDNEGADDTINVDKIDKVAKVDKEETPPPMPTRPNFSPARSSVPQDTFSPSSNGDQEEAHKFDGEYFTWYINELEGRKKRKIELSIGNGKILLKRPTIKNKTINEQEWKIINLVSFNSEKKHIFLDFKNPNYSIELHAGSKDVVSAIMSILGDLKGAQDAKGLKEVIHASKPSADSHKTGKLIYDFVAQSSDELNCQTGDLVYILDDTKSKDWWMCANIDTGKQGVVPSSYVEIVGNSVLDSLTKMPTRKKSTLRKSLSLNRKASYHSRDRDERDKIREKDNKERAKHYNQKDKEKDKSRPNIHRVRTWIDSSGSFKVEAEFLGCVDGKIHLHKTNGVKIAVGATKLSVEDLEYVEKITGMSLEIYKNEVLNQIRASKKKHESSGVNKSATAIINDVPLRSSKSISRASKSNTNTNESEYDWFEFFLNCGVDVSNCQRYTLNFNREQIDENILSDITPSLLRTLGLREGDILRVARFLDNKYNRKKASEPNNEGGLFTELSGALKSNRSPNDIPKIDASALPSSKAHPPLPNSSYDDDAWAVKPASRSTEDLSKKGPSPVQNVKPQFTGSMQDLVNVKPLPSNSNNIIPSVVPANIDSTNGPKPSAPALQPVKTGNLIQPGQQFQVTKTGNQNFVPTQPTGGLIPMQPTGFVAIAAQPTGFMPIQQTGNFVQGAYGIIPLQTGTLTLQKTGGLPQSSFGTLPLQPTGNFVPLQTGVLTLQKTGGNQFPNGNTGGQVPNTTFGGLSLQPTGNYIPLQKTGGQVQQNLFNTQSTGNLPLQKTGGNQYNQFSQFPTTSFGQIQTQQTNSMPLQKTGGFVPQSSFGQSMMPQTTFGNSFSPSQPIGFQSQPALNTTNSFNSFNSVQQQQTGFMPQPFLSQQSTYNQPSFMHQQQTQPPMNQLSNMFQNTNINQQQQPYTPTFNHSFGQPSTNTFGQPPTSFNQPLQPQPTGAGFGNAPNINFGMNEPLQSQPTGKRANLNAATPDNPFGF